MYAFKNVILKNFKLFGLIQTVNYVQLKNFFSHSKGGDHRRIQKLKLGGPKSSRVKASKAPRERVGTEGGAVPPPPKFF